MLSEVGRGDLGLKGGGRGGICGGGWSSIWWRRLFWGVSGGGVVGRVDQGIKVARGADRW